MSQIHLYGEDYTPRNPPQDWQISAVNLEFENTIDTAQTEFAVNQFTFVGDIADWIEDTHIPTYGVFNGVRYRIQAVNEFTGASTTIFDGFIDISRREILSKYPNIFTAPIVPFDDVATVLQQVSVYSQGLLEAQGFLNSSDFADVPVIRESKANLAERTVILTGLISDVVGLFTKLIQGFLSALSDILAISLPVGLVEMLLLILNGIIEINFMVDNINQHKDLFFPQISYYKGVKLKSLITKSFAKLGYTVDFGEIDEVLSKIVLLGSQDNYNGAPVPGLPLNGILKKQDYGYLISEAMDTVQTFFHTKQEIRDGVVHIKNKFDPFWTSSPSLEVENILIDSTDQYTNGTRKENTDNLPAVVLVGYKYDESDTHTLTEKTGDYYEIRRNLITELDPRLNLMRGIQEIKIEYAMAVRKSIFDNLLDLFNGVNAEFDKYLEDLKGYIEDYIDQIPEEAGVSELISELLATPFISGIIENRSGALKIDDNTYAIPKLIYLEDGKIPENFKDFIGAKAIYQNYYFKDSPADINDFKGQKVDIKNWTINFNLADYNLVKNNPYFEYDGNNLRFTGLNWIEDDKKAVTQAEEQSIFDTNITEYAIE